MLDFAKFTSAVVCLITIAWVQASPAQYTGTVYMSPCNKGLCPHFVPGIEDKHQGAAYGMFEDGEIAKADGGTGWGILYVNTNEKRELDDPLAMYAAGYLEGALTYQQIKFSFDDFQAQYFNGSSTPPKVVNFATQQLDYLRKEVEVHHKSDYWREVGLILAQMDGMRDAYNQFSASSLTDVDFFIINMDGDLLTVMPALGFNLSAQLMSHCSSLIRVAPGNADLFSGHDTWSAYESMVRIYKHYNFPLQVNFSSQNARSARRLSFSSYPAFLSSVDDWYINGNGLIVTETTNDIYNDSLYALITPVGVVMSFIRCMIASHLASSGPQWVEIFSRYNSGTYNNQWIIVDLKLFEPNSSDLKDNLLYIAEQIPGYIHSADVTSHLRQTGFWASYNVPYFPDIFQITGYAEMEKEHGNEYSYDNCARAKIFKRNASNVSSFAEYQRLMKYNDFQHDPLSQDNPDWTIMARSDLSPTPSTFGAIDSKTTTWTRALYRMSCDAMNGPTHQQQPPFSWTGVFKDFTHEGQPELFDFDDIDVAPDQHYAHISTA